MSLSFSGYILVVENIYNNYQRLGMIYIFFIMIPYILHSRVTSIVRKIICQNVLIGKKWYNTTTVDWHENTHFFLFNDLENYSF